MTAGLSTLVLAITQGHDWGWSSARTIGVFVLSVVARRLRRLGEPRRRAADAVRDPAHEDRLGANVAGFILGTALFSMFLMLTLYMQQVLGYSAMKTGVAYLAVAGTSIIWANVAAALVNRVGVGR